MYVYDICVYLYIYIYMHTHICICICICMYKERNMFRIYTHKLTYIFVASSSVTMNLTSKIKDYKIGFEIVGTLNSGAFALRTPFPASMPWANMLPTTKTFNGRT